ncbi:MAG TPA: hypothetical protein HA224_04675 [Nanoarchaeota archaeon]|nr:hypothetical protein [Nanoarchaeota archaeon]
MPNSKRADQILKLLISEQNLIWQKFAALLAITSLLLIAFVETEVIFFKIIITLIGIISAPSFFIILTISWRYHDSLWEKFNDSTKNFFKSRPQILRTKDVMIFQCAVIFMFWIFLLGSFF